MEKFIKLIRKIISFKPLLQHLKDLKEKSKEHGLDPKRKKQIFHQRMRIFASIIFAITAITTGVFIMFTFGIYIYNTSKIIEKMKSESADAPSEDNPYKKMVMEYPKIYSRALFDHAGIYALAMDLTEHLNTKEKKILQIYLYIKDRVRFISDDLPKSIYYFPDEVLEENEGNSREASLLTALMLRNIGIGSQIIEAGNVMYLQVSGINVQRYKEAMEELLEEEYVLFSQDFIINRSNPMVMQVPDRLTNVDLSVTVYAKHPILYEIVGANEESKESYRREQLTIETIPCRFDINDSIRVSTTEYPIVEASVAFSVNKSNLLKMVPQSENSDTTSINLSFKNKSILSFTGKTPVKTKNVTMYPVLPKTVVTSAWGES